MENTTTSDCEFEKTQNYMNNSHITFKEEVSILYYREYELVSQMKSLNSGQDANMSNE